MRTDPPMTPTGEQRQTCVFCNRQSADLPVYSIGVGRIGICLSCSRKAVDTLERHQKRNA